MRFGEHGPKHNGRVDRHRVERARLAPLFDELPHGALLLGFGSGSALGAELLTFRLHSDDAYGGLEGLSRHRDT